MQVTEPPQSPSGILDVDEFMAFLEARPNGERWHLIDGVAAMMAPRSFAHQRIASNLCSLLNSAFDAQALDLFAYSGTAVRMPGIRDFQTQPDVVVAPGVSDYALYSDKFHLVAEVLSPSNTRREIGLKLHRYREAADNLHTMVIEPREFLVEIHAKSRNWEPEILKQTDDPIEIPEFGLSCRVGDLYRGTPLDPQRNISRAHGAPRRRSCRRRG